MRPFPLAWLNRRLFSDRTARSRRSVAPSSRLMVVVGGSVLGLMGSGNLIPSLPIPRVMADDGSAPGAAGAPTWRAASRVSDDGLSGGMSLPLVPIQATGPGFPPGGGGGNAGVAPLDPGPPGAGGFRAASPGPPVGPVGGGGAFASAAPPAGAPGGLATTGGQTWQRYDLRPYTASLADQARPQQAIVDWVLRETGTDIWFGEPMGVLSASRDTLSVYHTPQVQRIVAETVARFTQSAGEQYVVNMRLLTVGSPDWRSKAFSYLRPVPVQTPGVEAWLMTRENAAILMTDLSRRMDVTEFEASSLVIPNGQSETITRTRPRSYIRAITPVPGSLIGYQREMGSLEEGFSVQIIPLVWPDGKTVDCVMKVQVDQVEKMIPVTVELNTGTGSRERTQFQVPQMASSHLHERFRWPTEHVLLISGGVGATPSPEAGKNPLGLATSLLPGGPPRADGLLLIEVKGRASQAIGTPDPHISRGTSFGPRY